MVKKAFCNKKAGNGALQHRIMFKSYMTMHSGGECGGWFAMFWCMQMEG
jgi:hypothetical protein